jgi:Zn-dependent protease
LLVRILNLAGLWQLIIAIFNLIPIPPLDGYWICRGLLPLRLRMTTDGFAHNPMIGFVLVFFVGSALLNMAIPSLYDFYMLLTPPF